VDWIDLAQDREILEWLSIWRLGSMELLKLMIRLHILKRNGEM
jgi:hypothetical protein